MSEISRPTEVHHNLKVVWNAETKKFEGEPKEEWDKVVEKLSHSGYTEEQLSQNPLLAKDILYPSETPISVSSPKLGRHDFGLKVTEEGKLVVCSLVYPLFTRKGHPKDKWEKVLAALKAKGVDIEEAQKDPSRLATILYDLDMDTVFGAAPVAPAAPSSPVKELKRTTTTAATTTTTTTTKKEVDKATVDLFLRGLLVALGFLFLGHVL